MRPRRVTLTDGSLLGNVSSLGRELGWLLLRLIALLSLLTLCDRGRFWEEDGASVGDDGLEGSAQVSVISRAQVIPENGDGLTSLPPPFTVLRYASVAGRYFAGI